MKKMNRLPHEQATPEGAPEHDGLPADGVDVEGHRLGRGDFLPGMPGTGGDNLRRPISGGEVDGDDVEGHSFGHTRGERFLPGMPGTGGDVTPGPSEDVKSS